MPEDNSDNRSIETLIAKYDNKEGILRLKGNLPLEIIREIAPKVDTPYVFTAGEKGNIGYLVLRKDISKVMDKIKDEFQEAGYNIEDRT